MRSRSRAPIVGVVVWAIGLCTGCLLDPQGQQRSWPPPLTAVNMVAFAAGDVDGDGLSDLVEVQGGTAADGAGIFFLRGGVDVRPDQEGTATTFTGFAPLAQVDPPVTVAVLSLDPSSHQGSVVATYQTDEGQKVSVLSGPTLQQVATVDVPGRASGAGQAAWVTVTPFGPGGSFVLFGAAGELAGFPVKDLSATPKVNVVPGPTNGFPGGVLWAVGVGDSSVAVVTPASVWRGDGIGAGKPIEWTQIRNGAAWSTPLALDLNGDKVPEILGLEGATAAKLCAIDPAAKQLQTCSTTEAGTVSAHAVSVLDDVTGDGKPDWVLLAGEGTAQVTVLPNVHLDSGAVVTSAPATAQLQAPATMLVTGRFNPGQIGAQVLALDGQGHLQCGRWGGSGLVPCHAP